MGTHFFLTLRLVPFGPLGPKKKGFANSVDPDGMVHNRPSQLDLFDLLCICFRQQ